MNTETLSIILTSWPLAVVLLAIVAAIAINLIVRQFRTWDQDDKVMRASQAREVTKYND